MKKLLAICLLSAVCASAQEKLDPLKAPSSPAAAVLGMQPATVLTPKSMRALETALYTNFANADGVTVPNDFGLEFTPYWFNDHGLSLTAYLEPKSVWAQIKRNLSLSVASSQAFRLGDSTETKSVAFGLRTSVFFAQGGEASQTRRKLAELEKVMNIRAVIASQIVLLEGQYGTLEGFLGDASLRKALAERIRPAFGVSAERAESMVDKIYERARTEIDFDANRLDETFTAPFLDLLEEELGGQYEKFKEYLKSRRGLAADFAYATFLNFPDGNFSYSIVPKQSVWLTPSYKFKSVDANITALAVFRYEWFQNEYYERYFPSADIYDHNLDVGVGGEVVFRKFSIQGECTWRSSRSLENAGLSPEGEVLYAKRSAGDFQGIATLSYRLTPQILLSYQFGQGFKPIFNPRETLVSLLALNFGFGGPDQK
jgi:hypothetical protein